MYFQGNRLRNFDVKIGNIGPRHYNGRHFHVIAHVHRPVGRSATMTINTATRRPVAGRFLVIQLRYRGYLTLCEVKVRGVRLRGARFGYEYGFGHASEYS